MTAELVSAVRKLSLVSNCKSQLISQLEHCLIYGIEPNNNNCDHINGNNNNGNIISGNEKTKYSLLGALAVLGGYEESQVRVGTLLIIDY